MLSVLALMNKPNPDSALNGASADAFVADYDVYVEAAREWTQQYAK